MITLASWKEPSKWVGRPIRISNSPTYHLDAIDCLIPPWEWVLDYRHGLLSEVDFRRKYIHLLAERHENVIRWMNNIEPTENITLLCHEPEGAFCHREIVGMVVGLWRPDIDVVIH